MCAEFTLIMCVEGRPQAQPLRWPVRSWAAFADGYVLTDGPKKLSIDFQPSLSRPATGGVQAVAALRLTRAIQFRIQKKDGLIHILRTKESACAVIQPIKHGAGPSGRVHRPSAAWDKSVPRARVCLRR